MKCRPNFYHPRRVALSSTACGVCITAKMPNQTHQTRGFMASFLRIRRAKNTIKYYLTQCASSLGWLQINVFFSIVKLKGSFLVSQPKSIFEIFKISQKITEDLFYFFNTIFLFRNFQDQPKKYQKIYFIFGFFFFNTEIKGEFFSFSQPKSIFEIFKISQKITEDLFYFFNTIFW